MMSQRTNLIVKTKTMAIEAKIRFQLHEIYFTYPIIADTRPDASFFAPKFSTVNYLHRRNKPNKYVCCTSQKSMCHSAAPISAE